MIEVFLIQSLVFVVPIFLAIIIWLAMEIALDVMNKAGEKKTAKSYQEQKPIDKTKEYFDL